MSRFEKMQDEVKEWQQQQFSANTDYLKHITTLSAGSIVLIATFIGNVFHPTIWRASIVAALLGFMTAIIAGTISYTITLLNQTRAASTYHWSVKIIKVLVYVILAGFMVGLICTGLFAIVNILHL